MLQIQNERATSFEVGQSRCLEFLKVVILKTEAKVDQLTGCSEILNKLKSGEGSKIELWGKLKVAVFAKIACLIHLNAFIIVLVSVHFNIKVGLLLSNKAKDTELSLEDDEFFLNNSISKLAETDVVEFFAEKSLVAAEKYVGNVSLKGKIDYLFVCNAIEQILLDLDHDPKEFMNIINDLFVSEEHPLLSNYALDVAMCPDFRTVLSSCTSKSVQIFSEMAEEWMASKFLNDNSINHVLVPMAKLIPLLNSNTSHLCSSNFTDRTVDNQDLISFCENIFEAFAAM